MYLGWCFNVQNCVSTFIETFVGMSTYSLLLKIIIYFLLLQENISL